MEDNPFETKNVADVVEELGLLTLGKNELQEKFGAKDWISDAVFLFNKLMNVRGSISLEEYLS